MIPILVACLAITSTGTCEVLEPPTEWWWASQYAESVFDRVIVTRQAGRTAKDLSMSLPDVDGFVAVVDCDQIGDVWTLRPVGQVRWETFLVADCAGPHLRLDGLTGRQWMIYNNVLVEVDYETAVRWKTVGRGIKIEVGALELERGRSRHGEIE